MPPWIDAENLLAIRVAAQMYVGTISIQRNMKALISIVYRKAAFVAPVHLGIPAIRLKGAVEVVN